MPIYTRYDRAHHGCVSVIETESQDNPLSELTENGLVVLTENDELADAFKVDTVDLDRADEMICGYLQNGTAYVWPIVFRDCGRLEVDIVSDDRYPPKELLNTAGFIVLKHDVAADLGFPEDRNAALTELQERTVCWIEALLNGEASDWEYAEPDGRFVGRGPFLSPEDALEDAVHENPQCCYCEEDFESVTTFSLKSRKAR